MKKLIILSLLSVLTFSCYSQQYFGNGIIVNKEVQTDSIKAKGSNLNLINRPGKTISVNDTSVNDWVRYITNLRFKTDPNRSESDGFMDVYLGQNNGNPSSNAGGNIGIGQGNLTSINTGGTWSGTPYFSTFRGDRNIAIGYNTGKSLTGGGANAASHNILLGNGVMQTTTQSSYNIFMGFHAARLLDIPLSGTNGQSNIGLGDYVMENTVSGQARYNVAIGNSSARFAESLGRGNTMIGHYAGIRGAGASNTMIGAQSGVPSDWTALGNGTAFTGNNSVFIGYRAGFHASTPNIDNVTVIGNDYQPTLATGNTYIGAPTRINLRSPYVDLTASSSGSYSTMQIINTNSLLNTQTFFLDSKTFYIGNTSYRGSETLPIPTGIRINIAEWSLTDGNPTIFEIEYALEDIGLSSIPQSGTYYYIKDTDGTGKIYKVMYDGANWHYWESNIAQ